MKINAVRNLESATHEELTIKIEWDPTNNQEEGYVALIATLCDLVQHTLVLDKYINDIDSEPDEAGKN